jgi:hypothetical protein
MGDKMETMLVGDASGRKVAVLNSHDILID